MTAPRPEPPLWIGLPKPRNGLERLAIRLAGEGIVGRFAFLATSLTVGLLVTAGVVSFLITVAILRDRLESELSHEAAMTAQRVELALNTTYLHGLRLAAHPLIANGLVDSTGREVYLRPFLQSDGLVTNGASIRLLDHRGHPIAGSGDPDGPAGNNGQSSWFAEVIGSATPAVAIAPGPTGLPRLRLAYPVIYSPTGTAEGLLLVETDLATVPAIAALSALPAQEIQRARLIRGGDLLAGAAITEDAIEVTRGLALTPPLDRLNLSVAVATGRWQSYRPVLDLLAAYLLLGVIGFATTAFLVRRTAERFAAPIRALGRAADEISRSGRIDIRPQGDGTDELSRLASAFGTMLDRLRGAQLELEQRVGDRTRELGESRQRLDSLLAALPDIVFSLTPDGTQHLYANDALQQVLGLDPIPAGTPADIFLRQVHPADVEGVKRLMGQTPQIGSGEAIYRAFRTNGEMRWLHTRMVAVHDDSGATIRLDGITTDITQRKLAEDRLRQSEERWELAMRGSNDGIWDWDLTHNRVYFSPRWKSMLGYADDEIGNDAAEWTERTHPDDMPKVQEALEAHLSRRTDFYQVEHRMRCRDGSYKWILSRGRALWNEQGLPIRMVGSHSDMSERRAFEEAIRERNQQLDTIFSLSPDGFVTIDEGGRVRYANTAFLRMTGLLADDVVDRHWSELDRRLAAMAVRPADYPGLSAYFPTSSPGDGMGQPARQGSMLTLAPPRGSILEMTGVFGSVTAGNRILYVRDVTREVEVDRMKTEFLSVAAHELRTPMASIFGFTELLLNEEFDAATRHDLLGTIYQQTELLVKIINELLDLSRIEARRGTDFQIEWLQPATLVREILAGLKIDTDRWRLDVNLPEDLGRVRADPGKLRQALINVLSNAIKYSPDGGKLTVSLQQQFDLNGVCRIGFVIRDEGIGMTPEQLGRVFERFYRADTSGRIPGTGLGMSIVKEIIELHGGSIDITSRIGEGTTVVLWLPARPDGEAAALPERQA